MSDKNYDIVIDGEPKEVTEIRHKILETFKDLEFYEEEHKYVLHGKELPSVSQITHQFAEEEDFDKVAENYSIKNGGTKEYWLEQWRLKSLKATTTGTLVHEFGESLGWLKNNHYELITDSCKCKYDKKSNTLIPTRPKEEAVIKFINDLPKSYHLVLNEARVYSGLNIDKTKNPKEQYSGCFDMLFWFDGGGDPNKAGLVILDYKTNASLENSFSRKVGKFLKKPFLDLYNESKSFYALQLSLYQIPLEDIGYKVLDRKLIWLKDDGTYEKVALPNFTEILRQNL